MCVYLQLKVGSYSVKVGYLAYYVNWIDYPENRNRIIASVAGGGGGLILLIVLVVIICVCVRRRRRRKRDQPRPISNGNMYTAGILFAATHSLLYAEKITTCSSNFEMYEMHEMYC